MQRHRVNQGCGVGVGVGFRVARSRGNEPGVASRTRSRSSCLDSDPGSLITIWPGNGGPKKIGEIFEIFAVFYLSDLMLAQLMKDTDLKPVRSVIISSISFNFIVRSFDRARVKCYQTRSRSRSRSRSGARSRSRSRNSTTTTPHPWG